MAVPTVTLDTPFPRRVGNTAHGILSGTVNISSYDTAHPEVTAITGKFLASTKLRVVVNGISSGGWLVKWDATTHSFLAYSALAQPATEATSTAAVGTADFIAMGQLG